MKGYVLAAVISVVLLFVTIRAIRKKQLTEMLAILWLGVSLAAVFLSALLPSSAFLSLSHLFGVAYPPTMVLVLGLFFLTLFTFYLSVAMSRLSTRQKQLVQDLALVQAMLDAQSAP